MLGIINSFKVNEDLFLRILLMFSIVGMMMKGGNDYLVSQLDNAVAGALIHVLTSAGKC